LLEHGGRDVSHDAQLGATPEVPSQLTGATGDVEDPIARPDGDVSGDPIKHPEIGKVRTGRFKRSRLTRENPNRLLSRQKSIIAVPAATRRPRLPVVDPAAAID